MSVELDWSKLPKEIVSAAVDENGTCWGHQIINPEPKIRGEWESGFLRYKIDKFIFSGYWKDSLTPRPEKTAGEIADELVSRITPEGVRAIVDSQSRREPPAGAERFLETTVGHGWESPGFLDEINKLKSARDRFRQALWDLCYASPESAWDEALIRAIKLLDEIP